MLAGALTAGEPCPANRSLLYLCLCIHGCSPLILCLEDHYLDDNRQLEAHLPQIAVSLACDQGSLLTLSTGQTAPQMLPPLQGFPSVHGQRSTGAPTAPCVSLCHPSHTARRSPQVLQFSPLMYPVSHLLSANWGQLPCPRFCLSYERGCHSQLWLGVGDGSRGPADLLPRARAPCPPPRPSALCFLPAATLPASAVRKI